MKNALRIAVWASLFIPTLTWGQSEIEVFSEVGDAFTMYLNQQQVNDAPSARVLTTVDPGYYQLRIDFAEVGKPDILKNNFGVEAGMRSTGKITMNRKGEYVVRPFGYAPIAGASAAPASTPHPAAATAVQESAPATNTGIQMNVTETYTESAPVQGTTESVQMKMNVGGGLIPGGVNMNVNLTTTTSATTTSTTTTTTTSGWGEPAYANPEPAAPASSNTMSDLDFNDYLASIQAKTFEDSKLSTAKAPLQSGVMLTAGQIAQVMRAMTYESSRLDFAVFAHSRCSDPHNYYKTHGAFDYELSIDDLNDAIGQ